MTDYFRSRWYRAPEIFLGSTRYGRYVVYRVHFWSIIRGKPMFPGTSTLNQIFKVLEITGKPSKEDIESINSELAQDLLQNVVMHKTKSLKCLYPQATENELDLLSKLLQFNPNKRIDVNTALEHNYVKEFHSKYSHTEIISDKLIHPPIMIMINILQKNIEKDYMKKF